MTDRTFTDTVSALVKEFVYSNINLSVPARVVNVKDYSTNQVIDVQPLINYFDEDGEAVEFPVIYSVIVCLQEAGGALFSLPVKVGDRVKLDFSKEGLDSYLLSAGTSPVTPLDKRKFAITDCFATLGCPTVSSNLHPNPTDVEIKFAGSSIKMKPNGDVEEYVAGNRKIIVEGDYQIESSTLTHNGVNISETHVHEQGSDSQGHTQVDTEVPK
tara:strand:- start:485 stop:1126 length:642 start_codon:yes stop_codon:yes gene_type:complete